MSRATPLPGLSLAFERVQRVPVIMLTLPRILKSLSKNYEQVICAGLAKLEMKSVASALQIIWFTAYN